MSMSVMNGIHERVKITAESEHIAQGEIVLRIFAIIVRKNEEREAAVIERERTRQTRQIFHAEMSEHDT